MLKRLKNAKPRYKVLIGLWLAVELISLPAAASVAFSFTGKTAPLLAETIETTEPGTAQFLVTHSVPFDILVSGVNSDVNVLVEDAHWDFDVSAACAHFNSPHPRIVKTVNAPTSLEKPIAALFVTITYDPLETPEISFDKRASVPPALPCQSL